MFVLTVKSKLKSKRAKIVLFAVAFVLCLLIVFACVSLAAFTPKSEAYCESVGEYSTLAKTDEQVKEFAEQFYKVGELYSLQEVYVPIEFNEKYEQYNALQNMQGLDLEPYKGEKCKLYMYEVLDFESENKMFMSVMVYRERVIGGDISPQVEDGGWYTFYGEKVV